jgi:hypothetical protein
LTTSLGAAGDTNGAVVCRMLPAKSSYSALSKILPQAGASPTRIRRVGSVSDITRIELSLLNALFIWRDLERMVCPPRTNGKAERFIQTLLREWAYAVP